MCSQLSVAFDYEQEADIKGILLMVTVMNERLEEVFEPVLVTPRDGWSIELPAGIYLVTVWLPSGQYLRATQLVDEAETSSVVFDIKQSCRSLMTERLSMLSPIVSDNEGRDLFDDTETGLWMRLWSLNDLKSENWRLSNNDLELLEKDNFSISYKLNLEDQYNLLQVGGPRVPWHFISAPPTSAVTLIITRTGADNFDFRFDTRNDKVESLLAFSQNNIIEGASQAAELLLESESSDPNTLIVLGYYLLRCSLTDKFLELELAPAKASDWLADGLILSAWQHVYRGRLWPEDSFRQFEIAADEFLTATSRGLPVYTEGLWLLADGLRLLTGASALVNRVSEIQLLLNRVDRYLAAADRTACTVKFSGSNPADPSLNNVYGVPDLSTSGSGCFVSGRSLSKIGSEFGGSVPDGASSVKAVFNFAKKLMKYSPAEAEFLLRQALALDFAPASVELANLILKTGEEESGEAEALLRSAAEAGMPEAMNNLAVLVADSNPGEAVKLLRRAVALDFAPASVELANLILKTGEEESGEAEALLRSAAEAGMPEAMNDLGMFLKQSDSVEAEFWLRQASALNDFIAMNNLGVLIIGTRRAEAVELIEAAALGGVKRAKDNLAIIMRASAQGSGHREIIL